MASVFVQALTEATSSKVPGRTAFYAEFGGPGILFSANIDSRFKPSIYCWGFRGGLGFVTANEEINNDTNGFSYEMRSVVTVPVQINYIFGKSTSVHTLKWGGLTVFSKKLDFLNYTNNNKSNLFRHRLLPRQVLII